MSDDVRNAVRWQMGVLFDPLILHVHRKLNESMKYLQPRTAKHKYPSINNTQTQYKKS